MSHLCFQQEKRRHNRHIRGFINLWGSPGDKELFAGITNQDPPTLIIHGDQDLTVPYQNSEMLAEGLKKAGVYCELHPFEGAGHTPTDQMDRIIALVESFLARPEVSHP